MKWKTEDKSNLGIFEGEAKSLEENYISCVHFKKKKEKILT